MEFKAGDKVRINPDADCDWEDYKGCPSGYFTYGCDLTGLRWKVGTITGEFPDGDTIFHDVEFDNVDKISFQIHGDHLLLDKPQFKKGDRVRIVKKIHGPTFWADKMDYTIGKLGTVKHISESGVLRVLIDGGNFWNYDADSLKLIEEGSPVHFNCRCENTLRKSPGKYGNIYFCECGQETEMPDLNVQANSTFYHFHISCGCKIKYDFIPVPKPTGKREWVLDRTTRPKTADKHELIKQSAAASKGQDVKEICPGRKFNCPCGKVWEIKPEISYHLTTAIDCDCGLTHKFNWCGGLQQIWELYETIKTPSQDTPEAPPKSRYETHLWLRLQLPDGRMAESPEPVGDGWEVFEAHQPWWNSRPDGTDASECFANEYRRMRHAAGFKLIELIDYRRKVHVPKRESYQIRYPLLVGALGGASK